MAYRDIEVQEAIDAVDDALNHLRSASEKLGSAGRWGWFDVFVGDGLTSLIKHGKMRDAQMELQRAQTSMVRLASELRDVEGFAALGPDVGDFLTFADFLFDNPFVDMFVQQKIGEAQDRVEDAIRNCERMRSQLVSLQRPNRAGGNGLPTGE